MKQASDAELIAELSPAQRGVFSTGDLRTALAERHPTAFGRRVGRLLDRGVLTRFTRGYYVARDFELPVLSQRIAPESCISFETVLARELVIGTNPTRRVVATKIGRTRSYRGHGFEVEHVGLSPHLAFGFHAFDGVRYADLEKAVLDVLYFHLRGRRYAFDLYSDMNLRKLDRDRIGRYLKRYRNPKFVAFARGVLERS